MTEVSAGPATRLANRPLSGVLFSRWLAFGVAVGTILLDQTLKFAVTGWLGPDAVSHRWELAGSLLAFEYVENPGAAFGLLRGQTGLLILAALAATVLVVLGISRLTAASRMVPVGFGFLLGGALGNLLDRVRLGYVVDFLAVGMWPKFNVADSAITVGLVLLGWYSLFSSDRVDEKSDEGSLDR